MDPGFGRAVSCPCQRQTFEQRRRASLMKYCNLPDTDSPRTFDNYTIPPGSDEMLRAALDVVEGIAKFATFIGPVNTGKTHLASAICHEYIDNGIPAKFYSTGIFLRDLRETFDHDSVNKYHTVFDRACTVPLLVLDDFYQGKRTDWMTDELENLVNERYLAKLPTVFTTNVPLSEMSERVASRLQRESWCRVVVVE